MARGRLRNLLAAATALALAVRLAAALYAPIPPTKDAAEYHELAARFAAGRGLVTADGVATAFRPPGYPVFLGLVYAFTGADPRHGRVASCVVGALAVPFIGLLSWRLGGPRAAWVAAWLAAIYPPFVTSWFSPRALLSEVLLTTLVVIGLWLGMRTESTSRAVLAGVVAGLALLTKPTAIALPLALSLAFLWRPRPLKQVALLWLGAVLTVAPWVLRNRAALGAWVPVSTNGGISIWASYNPASRGLGNGDEGYALAHAEDAALARAGVSEVERSRLFMARASAAISAEPRRALWLVVRKVVLFADPTLKDWSRPDPPLRYDWAYGVVLPLATLAAACGLRFRELRADLVALIGFVALFAAIHVILHVDVRYRVSLEPCLLIGAGVAVAAAVERWGWSRVLPAATGYSLLHLAVALRYETVFGWLRGLVGAVGLA